MLEKVENWLKSCPLWQQDWVLTTDHIGAEPDSQSLYPMGIEEMERREDVLGNVTVLCRSRFRLRRVMTAQQDNKENALWLLALQQWIQQQSAMGLAPCFGDEKAQERIRAEQGKLEERSQTGTATYTVMLIIEYVKYY